jgi:tetratricopeptide (TPR) repeat protein
MSPAALLLSTLLLAAPGKPPSAEEQRLFDEGMKAMQAGDAHAADKAWRAGYAVAKDPAFLVRMGEAEEKAGQPAEAGESYRRYLRAVPDASDRAEIEQRLARLGQAGAPPAAPPDTHEVPGAFGQGPPPPTVPGAPPPPAPPPGATPRARDDEMGRSAGSDEDASGWNPYNVTAWVATGATVLALGTAAYYAASAASAKDDVNQLLRYQNPVSGAALEYQTVAAKYENSTRDGQHDDRVAKGALLVAAGTAMVATAFFIIDSVRTPEPHAERTGPRPGHSTTPVFGLALRPEGNHTAAFSALRWSF